MANLTVVVHERLANWARQLRPRLLSQPVRLLETRSAADLRAALTGAACPLVVIDLAQRLKAGLEDLDLAVRSAPGALILVLDPGAHEGVDRLARELGATHVLSGVATPPEVAGLLLRWLPLAQRRTEADGWSHAARTSNEPEPWNWLTPLLAEALGTGRGTRT